MSKNHLYQLVDQRKEGLTDLSDRIWGFAETRFEENQSSEALCKALEAEGFRAQRNVGGVPNAFVGTFSTAAGDGHPVIGFLGEYDALSGISQKAGLANKEPLVPGGNGHGCGHNFLGVASLGAAAALKEYAQETGIPLTIKYFGCPGEEGGSGKAFMARAGLFDGLDVAITWHSGSVTAVSTGSSLANIQVYYRFIGKSSHAAGSPHLGRSALDAVELMNVGVNYLREHVIPEARVHYALINAGGKSPNVVQPEAEILYLIRAPKNDQVQGIFQRVSNIARGAAMMTETTLEIQVDKACSNIVPNEVLEKVMQANLESLDLPEPTGEEIEFALAIRDTLDADDRQNEMRSLVSRYGERDARKIAEKLQGPLCTMVLPYKPSEKIMSGSTDVGDVSWIVPTVQCNFSCHALGTPGHSWQMVAQGKSTWAHKGMLGAAKAMVGTALDLLLDPSKVEEAKEELQERVGGEPYRCPIPEGVNPSPVKKG